MRIPTTLKSTTLIALIILGTFALSAEAIPCPRYHKYRHDMDHDFDWDMDMDYDHDFDLDFDSDFDSDFDFDWDMDMDDWDHDMDYDMDDWDEDCDYDFDHDFDFDFDHDFDFDFDADNDFDSDYDSDSDDLDGAEGVDIVIPDIPIHELACKTDSDCDFPGIPFCLETDLVKDTKICQPCFALLLSEEEAEEDIDADDDPANKKCAALNKDRPMCTLKGHCGKDQRKNLSDAKGKRNQKYSPDELADELGFLADAAFGDGELASDDTEEIMDAIMFSLFSSTENIDDADGLDTFMETFASVAKNSSHLNEDAAKNARKAIGNVLGQARGFAGGFSEETRKNIGASLSDTIKGTKNFKNAAEKREELGNIDNNMREFAKIAARNLSVGGDPISVDTDEIKMILTRVTAAAVAEQECAADATDCANFPAEIGNQLSSACSRPIDIEFMNKSYNANESDAGTTDISANSTEVNLNCSGETDTSVGTAINVSGLTTPITFKVAVANDAKLAENPCQWWDESTNSWSTEGMTAVLPPVNGQITCTTTHLTEFAIASTTETSTEEKQTTEEEEETTTKPTDPDSNDDDTTSANSLFFMPVVMMIFSFIVVA